MRPIRSRAAAVATAAALLAGVGVAAAGGSPVSAGTAATPNACLYSYDSIWRDVAVSFTGAATPNPATAGAQITLSGATVTAAVPAGLIEYAYNSLGMLATGVNTFPVQVWVALRATNTAAPVQVVQLSADATTTISGSAPDATATPLTFTASIPTTTWTATGGDVAISQAGLGSLGTLAGAGIGGATVTPTGSVYVATRIGDTGPQLRLDCLSGQQATVPGSNPLQFTYAELPAPAFDAVTVPGGGTEEPPPGPSPTFECASNLGAFAGREVLPLDLTLETTAAPQASNGQVTLRALELQGTIPGNLLADLYGRGQAALGETTHNATAYVAVAGTNTVEGTQVAIGNFEWTSNISDPTPDDRWGADPTKNQNDPSDPNDATAADAVFTVTLANTTWTSTGPGEVAFSLAPAGSLPRLTIIGHGYGGLYPTFPYGSVFIRSETGHYGSNLDCVNGDIEVNTGTACNANNGVVEDCIPPRSLYGNIAYDPAIPDPVDPNATAPIRGSQGRYAITEGGVLALATAQVVAGNGTTLQQVTTFNVVGSPLRLGQANSVFAMSSVSPGATSTGNLAPLTVTDLRGTNSGWTLTGQASPFSNAGDSIAADSAGWVPGAQVTSGSPESQVSAGQSLASGLGSPQTLCSSPVGHSGGVFECGAQVRLAVPATAERGTYSGTFTLTLI